MPHDKDARHWRQRAEEARTEAAGINDSDSKRLLLTIANGYELLAKRAEQWPKEDNGTGTPL